MYASAESWHAMAAWPLAMRYVVPARHQFAVAGLLVEAWPVEHSVLAPAVGYRVTASGNPPDEASERFGNKRPGVH